MGGVVVVDEEGEEEVGVWLVDEAEAIVILFVPGLACTEESREGWMRAGFSRVEGALYGQFKAWDLVLTFSRMYN